MVTSLYQRGAGPLAGMKKLAQIPIPENRCLLEIDA
jgi:hypothetical protein